MFVVLPAHHIQYLIEMFENFWVKPDAAHHLLMLSYAAKKQK